MKFFRDKKKIKILVVILVLLVFFNFIGFTSLGQSIFKRILNPSGSFFYRQGKNIEQRKASRSQLLDKINSLEEELGRERVSQTRIYNLEEENEKLRQYLNFFSENSFNYLLANIIWQENYLNFSHYNQNIVIDKGASDGLREGLAVVNDWGAVVGKIIEVGEKNSRVCLMNNNFCKMAVSLKNLDRSIGLAEGNLGLSIKVNFVPQNEKVEVNDLLISSGLEKEVPRGLAIGIINSVEQEVSDIWQNINAEALFDFNNLNIVAIIIPE